MGIKNLSKIIKKMAPNAIREITIEDLRGKTVALDVPIFMYKFTYINPDDPLEGFRMQLKAMRDADIHPIYIFDGVATPMKQPELEKRRELKRKAVDDLASAEQKLAKVTSETNNSIMNFGAIADAHTGFEKARKKVISVPTAQSYRDLQAYFTAENVDWIQAKHDAEKTAANLVSDGKAYAVISEDFDTLPYLCGGGTSGKMVTGFTKETMVEYDLTEVLRYFNMSPNQFVDFCILSGSDLCEKIKNVAGKRALTLVQAHGSIERIVQFIDTDKYPVPVNFGYNAARKEFGVLQ